jgi:hypothetical protein
VKLARCGRGLRELSAEKVAWGAKEALDRVELELERILVEALATPDKITINARPCGL